MSQIELLNSNDHRNLKLNFDNGFSHAKSHHMTYLLVHEFPKAALNFPIVFVKDQETGLFKSVAIFGFEENENVFYSPKQWNTTYVPANLRRYPFLMSQKNESGDEWSICVDAQSEMLSTDSGERLFDDEGKHTQQLQNIQKFLSDFIEKEEQTKKFVKDLADKQLLKSNSIKLKNNRGEEQVVNGLYTVDEEKLEELEDAEYLELKNKGYIGPIYSHLTSMGQIERVMLLRNYL